MFRLPISGREVELRLPQGWDDLLLLEQHEVDTELAIRLADRLARGAGGESVDAGTLTITDFEVLLLLIRRMTGGEVIRTDVSCPASGCGARVDVDFRVGDYIAHHVARVPSRVAPVDQDGWFRLEGDEVRFRLPIATDQVAAQRALSPELELRRRCLRPTEIHGRTRARVESAMAAMAPSLSHGVDGSCPECGARFEMFFDVQRFVLEELRGQAAFLFEDVHLLASHYHWPEPAILDLPQPRRVQYAGMIGGATG